GRGRAPRPAAPGHRAARQTPTPPEDEPSRIPDRGPGAGGRGVPRLAGRPALARGRVPRPGVRVARRGRPPRPGRPLPVAAVPPLPPAPGGRVALPLVRPPAAPVLRARH